MGFLQPVLIPFAVAAVLAFLLDPMVRVLTARTRLSRTLSVFVVLGVVVLLLVLLFVSVVPRMYDSTVQMVRDLPAYTAKAQKRITGLIDAAEARLNKFQHLLPVPSGTPAPSSAPEASPTASASPGEAAAPWPPPAPRLRLRQSRRRRLPAGPAQAAATTRPRAPTAELRPDATCAPISRNKSPALESKVPAVLDSVWHLLFKSLGAVGTLLDLIIIPVYLYFLLVESHNIARRWSEYLPIRDSPFKKEVVSVLLEINGYLVAFFRGQLLVSTIDGILIGGALAWRPPGFRVPHRAAGRGADVYPVPGHHSVLHPGHTRRHHPIRRLRASDVGGGDHVRRADAGEHDHLA